jgi:hypothetical protein
MSGRLFFDDAGDGIQPTVMGASAGLNSAMFFTCPLCGACVVDMHFNTANRVLHEQWHELPEMPDD